MLLPVFMTHVVEGADGSHEFLLIDDFSGRHGQWVKTNTFSTIEDGKLFAPGNLRGTQVKPCNCFCLAKLRSKSTIADEPTLAHPHDQPVCLGRQMVHVPGSSTVNATHRGS